VRELSRWPVLLVAALAFVGAVTLDRLDGAPVLSSSFLCLGSACVGAFLYAEGVRHDAGDDSAGPVDDDDPQGPRRPRRDP
jgi:hypothetical protein